MNSLKLKPFDVVLTPFPFIEKPRHKRRPALVLSAYSNLSKATGLWVMAMITSAQHSSFPLDVIIKNPAKAGLIKGCMVRMKIFTLDERVMEKKLGSLQKEDQKEVEKSLKKLFPYLG